VRLVGVSRQNDDKNALGHMAYASSSRNKAFSTQISMELLYDSFPVTCAVYLHSAEAAQWQCP